MNQRTIKVILLERDDGEDVLRFIISDEEMYEIELNKDSCQSEIKKLFSKLLSISINEDILLDYSIDDNYSRTLYKEVCSEYIKDLQNEIENSTQEIRKQLS